MQIIETATFLLHALIASLWCCGVYKSTDDGMIMQYPAYRIRKVIGSYWSKPLFDCTLCMSSVHGITAFVILNKGISFWVIPFGVCVCGLNWLITSIADR